MRDFVIGADHDAGQGAQRRADHKGSRDDTVAIDAHQVGHGRILRRRTHRHTQLGAIDQEQQRAHGQRRDHDDDDLDQREIGPGEFEIDLRQDRREGQIVTAPGDHRHVLQDDRHADGRDQRRQTRRIAQRTIRDPFQAPAEQHAAGHGRAHAGQTGEQRRHAGLHQGTDDGDGDQGADHDHFAVREVDQAHDAVHHRVAQGDEGINAPLHQAVDDLLKKNIHVSNPDQRERHLAVPFMLIVSGDYLASAAFGASAVVPPRVSTYSSLPPLY